MLVMKFGGTSLATAAAIERVCAIVERARQRDPAVVVSAIGATTDQLAAAADSDLERGRAILADLRNATEATARAVVSEADSAGLIVRVRAVFDDAAELLGRIGSRGREQSAELDALLACGERISSEVTAFALRERGVAATLLDARDLFVTESQHGGADALFEVTKQRLRAAVPPVLAAGAVPVMGGFIATGEDGTATTLGRGGSDFTASLAGAALNAEEVQIWTDVDGVMTADPSLISSAQSLSVMSLLEASELAYFGGRVLHPATMLPAIEHGIPIRVLNSLRPAGRGTLIVKHPPESEQVVKAVVYKENITLIDIYSTRMLMAHGFLAKIFAIFERHETAVDMVSTSEVSVSLTVDRSEKLAQILSDLGEFAQVKATPGKAIVCVVGERIRYTLGIAARVFQVLEGIHIRMISLGASRVNVGFVVDEDQLAPAVSRIHSAFFPELSQPPGASQQ